MLDTMAEHNAIERMVSGSGTKVVWLRPEDDQTPRACLKTRTLYMPKLKTGYTPEEARLHRAYFWHEHGHLDPSQDDMLPAMNRHGISFGSYLGKAVNAVDDLWQEMVTSRKYPGAASDLDFCQAWHCKRGYEMVRDGGQPDEFIYKVLSLMYLARAEWQTRVADHADAFATNTSLGAWVSLIPRLNSIIDHPNPAEETISIAKELFEDEDSPNPEEQPQEPEDATAGDGGEKGEDGDESESDAPITVSYKDLMAHDHDEDGSPHPVTIIYDHAPEDNYQPAALDKYVLGYPEKDRSYNALMDSVREETAQVSAGIRRLFQSESQTKKLGLQKRGRITPKHLSRLPAGEDRIFHKKVNRLRGEADVLVAVDCSGSMHGQKFGCATNAAISLSEALYAANIPLRVIGFSEMGGKIYHWTIKDWQEPATYETMRDYFSGVSLMDNADGDSLMQCHRELSKRSNKRKVLIVLSDGQPATCRPGDCYTYTKKVAKFLESKYEVYGLGIMDRTASKIYKNSLTVNHPSEIEPALEKIVTQILLESK